MKVCKKCGKEYEDDVSFCKECGERLVDSDKFPVEEVKHEKAGIEEKGEEPVKPPEPPKEPVTPPQAEAGLKPDVPARPSPIPEVAEVISRFDSKLAEVAELRETVKKMREVEKAKSDEIGVIVSKLAEMESEIKKVGELEEGLLGLKSADKNDADGLWSVAKGLKDDVEGLKGRLEKAEDGRADKGNIEKMKRMLVKFDSKLKRVKELESRKRAEPEDAEDIRKKIKHFYSRLEKVGELEKDVKGLERREAEDRDRFTSIDGKLKSVTLLKREIKDLEEDVEEEKKEMRRLSARITRSILGKIRRGLFMKKGEKQSKTIMSLREGIKKLVSETQGENLANIKKDIALSMESRIQRQNQEIEGLRAELREGIKAIQAAVSGGSGGGKSDLESKISELEQKIEQMKSFEAAFEQELKNINKGPAPGELESIRQKLEQIETADLRPLQQRIEQLERKLNAARMSAPIVIE